MVAGANGRVQGRPNLLPAGSPPVRPYVLAQILADVGASPTDLSERTVRRIKRSFPIPVEQEVVWADVEFGTRTHGLVLTDAGVFLKDGPSDDGDADDSGDAAGIEVDGLGFSYVRWESFDVARVSHVDGAPTLDKARFLDGRPFKSFAMACVRINNRRVRMRNAGRRLARSEGLFAPDGPVRSVCRSTAAASVSFCFDKDGEYKFVDDDGLPVAMEVPFDQYDAALQRMRKKIEGGCIRPLDDPNLCRSVGAVRLVHAHPGSQHGKNGNGPAYGISRPNGFGRLPRPQGAGPLAQHLAPGARGVCTEDM